MLYRLEDVVAYKKMPVSAFINMLNAMSYYKLYEKYDQEAARTLLSDLHHRYM